MCTQGAGSCLVPAAPVSVSPPRPLTLASWSCAPLAGSSRVGTRIHSLRLVQGTRGSVVELKPSCGPAGAVEGQGGCSGRICSYPGGGAQPTRRNLRISPPRSQAMRPRPDPTLRAGGRAPSGLELPALREDQKGAAELPTCFLPGCCGYPGGGCEGIAPRHVPPCPGRRRGAQRSVLALESEQG